MSLNEDDRKTLVDLQMGKALFIHHGLASKRHTGMLSQFGLHFIKTGIIEDRLGGFLTRMEQLREKGDYNCFFSINEEELNTIVEPAHELVKVIAELIQR